MSGAFAQDVALCIQRGHHRKLAALFSKRPAKFRERFIDQLERLVKLGVDEFLEVETVPATGADTIRVQVTFRLDELVAAALRAARNGLHRGHRGNPV